MTLKNYILLSCFVSLLQPSLTQAQPKGAHVVQGSAQLSESNNTLSIINSDKTIINWNSFNIDQHQTTHFIQPSKQSSVLNRVISNNPSKILGQLNSNGRVFVINQHGILIGEHANINTQSFFASTLNISDENFNNGVLTFNGQSHSGITNKGYIRAGENGNIVLLASHIENDGVIEVLDGNIILAAGKSITITDIDNNNLTFTITANNHSITNLGSLITHKGSVSLFADSLTHEGHISATGFIEDNDGNIRLVATQQNTINGSIQTTGEHGGYIEITGEKIHLLDQTFINASGTKQGGEILIGGDQQGLNPDIKNAQTVRILEGANIDASATQVGNGGKIITFAHDDIHIHGELKATGGSQSGDGGFIETSGLKHINISTTPDASAANGQAGSWLIDPNNINIVSGSSNSGINNSTPFLTTQDSAQLGVNLITNSLNSGTSVIISTQQNGVNSEDGDINLNTAINSTTGSANVTLTLNAHNDININADIIDTGLGLELILNPDTDSDSNGIVNFDDSTLTIGDITINGASEVVGDLVINNSANIIVSDTLTIKDSFSITFANDRTITGTLVHEEGTLTNNGNLSIENYTFQGGSLEGTGTTTVTNTLLVEDGPTNNSNQTVDTQHLINMNSGSFDATTSGFYFNNGANFTNNGTFLDQSYHSFGNIFDDSSTFTNTGTYSYDNSAIFKKLYFPISNSGTLELLDGELNLVDSSDNTIDLDIGTGTLKGIGGITANVTASSGSSITPTVDAGSLNIDGDLTFNSGSSLNIDVETIALYSQLAVTGTVQIDTGSTLNVSAVNGYAPTVSDSFVDVFTATSSTGSFSTISADAFSLTTSYIDNLTLTIAQLTNQWTGLGGNQLWSDAANWSNGIPTTGDAVVINLGAITVNATSITNTFSSLNTASGTNLTLSSSAFTLSNDSTLGGTLNLTLSTLTSNGDLSVSNITLNNSSLIGNNTILNLINTATFVNTNIVTQWSNVATDDLDITGGTSFTNVTYTQDADINLSDSSSSLTFDNSILTSDTGATFSGTGGGLNFVTTSQWNVDDTISNTGQVNISVTNSDLVLNNGSFIDFTDPTIFDLYSLSNLSGNGSINAAVNNIAGSIDPGTSSTTGNIALIGNFTQSSQALTKIDLDDSSGIFDTLTVRNGTATLDGTLQISNLGTSSLVTDTSIAPLNFSSKSGDFSTITDGSSDILGQFNNGIFTALRSDISFDNSTISFATPHLMAETIKLANEINNKEQNDVLSLVDGSLKITPKSGSTSLFVCR